MQNRQHLENYIRQRLTELDKEKDMQEVTLKGKLSFGIDSRLYSHLPNWKNLVEKKKQLVKLVWLDAFLLSLLITGIIGDVWEKLEANVPRALLQWLLLSVIVMLFWIIGAFYSLFYHFRKAEREVRRLIYEDILHQLKKEEKEAA